MPDDREHRPQRRLSDLIAQAYFRSRIAGYELTADHLRVALESLVKYEAEKYPDDRRKDLKSRERVEFILNSAHIGDGGTPEC